MRHDAAEFAASSLTVMGLTRREGVFGLEMFSCLMLGLWGSWVAQAANAQVLAVDSTRI